MKYLFAILATVAALSTARADERIDQLNAILGSMDNTLFAPSAQRAQALSLVTEGLKASLDTCLVGPQLDLMRAQIPEYAATNSCESKIAEAGKAGLTRDEVQQIINSVAQTKAAKQARAQQRQTFMK